MNAAESTKSSASEERRLRVCRGIKIDAGEASGNYKVPDMQLSIIIISVHHA